MAGFAITAKQEKPNRFDPAKLLPAILCAAFCAILCGMAGEKPYISALMSLLALYPLLCGRGKRFNAISAAMFAVSAVFVLTQLQGVEAVLNSVFSASEKVQAYEYDYFAVEHPNKQLAIAALSMLFAVCIGFGSYRVPRFTAWEVLVGAFLLTAYFGIAADVMWTLLLIASAALMLLKKKTVFAMVTVIVSIAVIAAATLALVPESIKQTQTLNETLRDRMAFHTVSHMETPEETPEPTPEPTPTPQVSEKTKYLNINKNGWTKTHTLICIIMTTALVLFIPSVINDRYKKRLEKNRTGLKSKNNAKAVKAGFLYALKWLEICGYRQENLPFEKTAEQLSEELRPDFCLAAEIFREAVYSDHKIDDEKRALVHGFADECRAAALADKKPLQKLRIKYKYAL